MLEITMASRWDERSQGPLAARCLSLKSDAQRLEGDLAVKAGDWCGTFLAAGFLSFTLVPPRVRQRLTGHLPLP